MRLSGYRVPGDGESDTGDTVGAALFGGLSADEREELLEYLAWYRARRRSSRHVVASGVTASSGVLP
jgi:hypothetical protein